MNIKKITSLAVAATLCLSMAGCSDKANEHSVEAIKNKGKIVFATESQYAPFCFKDKTGKFVGLEPVLMQAIATDLGVELEIMDIAFDSVVPTVQAGGADVAMAGLTPDAARKEALDMTVLYNLGGQSLVVRAQDAEKYSTKDALNGKALAVQQGSLQQKLATAQFPECQQLVLPAIPSLIEELKAGNVEGVLMDDVSSQQYVKINEGVLVISAIPVEVPAEEMGSSAGVMKGNEDLLKYLNDFFGKLEADGSLKKWFEDASTLAKELGEIE